MDGDSRPSSDGATGLEVTKPVWKSTHWLSRDRGRVLAGLLLACMLCMTSCAIFKLDTDVAQERWDMASPPLDGTRVILQTFVSRHPNLCEIEVLPAVYEVSGQGALVLHLYQADSQGAELAHWSVAASAIVHNQPLRFTFAPLDSVGKTYLLRIDSTADTRIGLWYDSVDAYGEGELRIDEVVAGDLHFVTRCRFDLASAWRTVEHGLQSGVELIIPMLLILLPGYLLWHGLENARDRDPVANLAWSLSLSLAVMPLILQWSTVVGLRWGARACWVVFAGLAVWACVRLWRTRGHDVWAWWDSSNRTLVLAALALLSLTWVVRFLEIRGLVLPAWVDSPQHALVSQLIELQGQVPRSYEPLLAVNDFFYHFGWHVNLVVFHWLSGLSIPQAMLVLGQAFNAACALTVYLLTLRLTGRKLAAIVSMLVVGLVSYMPAYYVTWGRYTQLTGVLLLPAAMVASLDWLEVEKRNWSMLGMAALLQSGLFLTHARVSVYGVCFFVVYVAYEGVRRFVRRERMQAVELGRRASLLAGLALGCSAPWLWRVVSSVSASLRASGRGLAGDPSYNAFPWGLLWVPHNRALIALAICGAGVGLFRREKGTVLILGWMGLVTLLLNPGVLGLPATGLVNNATAVIALFLPLAALSGQAFVWFWDLSRDRCCVFLSKLSQQRMPMLRVVLVLMMVALAVWGAWSLVSVVNPVTVLATAADLDGMRWIQENTAPSALFMVNSRLWQLSVYAGTDGGYWIPLLTGRRTLLPSFPYTYGTPSFVRHVTDVAKVVSEAKSGDDSGLWSVIEQEQVDYVYIGARGGRLTPQMFLSSSRYRVVYNNGEVWIFQVER